MQVSHLL